MDIISLNEAVTANGRIESFIENPDSMSGVVTVPKVIASGETITIPAGRVAILPNVQIDGVLNVENGGEVFIPSGASLNKVVEKVTSTDNAIVRFDGTTGEVQNSGVIIDDSGTITTQGLVSTSPLYGIGYGIGSGGTVTQLTSKSTSVTLNKPTGEITMNNATLAAGASVEFTLNNTSILTYSIVTVNPIWGAPSYKTEVVLNTTGAVIIRVTNITLGSLSDALSVRFNVILGALS